MAIDERTSMSANMNDIDTKDMSTMTQEREKLQMNMTDADKKLAKQKKST